MRVRQLSAALVLALALYGPIVQGDDKAQESVTQPAGQSAAPHKLVIRKAEYGDLPNGPTVDVTDKVRAMVKDGALSVDASRRNFGVDPANGIKPTVTKVYMNVPNLNLGGPDGAADITDKVKDMVTFTVSDPVTIYYRYGDGKTLSKKFASGQTAGVPPYIPYTLRVDYTLDGVEMSKTTSGFKPVEINVKGEATRPTFEQMVKESMKVLADSTATLETVTDEASAKAALPKFEDHVQRMDLIKTWIAAATPTDAEKEKIAPLADEMQRSISKAQEEFKRIRAIPAAEAVLGSALDRFEAPPGN